jgi:hypothetical protein
MRSKVVVSGTVATVVAGTVLTVSAAQGERAAPRITVVEHAVSDSVVDVAPEGDSPGDLLTFANKVYDSANAKAVGDDDGWCIRTVAGKSWECAWTTTLAGGQIMVAGPFLDAGPSKLAIVGGTGGYKNARGWMDLRARNAKGTEYDFVFHVS